MHIILNFLARAFFAASLPVRRWAASSESVVVLHGYLILGFQAAGCQEESERVVLKQKMPTHIKHGTFVGIYAYGNTTSPGSAGTCFSPF